MSEPGSQGGPLWVEGADGVPHPEQYIGQTLLPVPLVGKDWGDDVPQQRGVRRLELLHRPILPGLQGLNQLHVLHDVSLLLVCMFYYTPETEKSHTKIF